MLSYYDFHIKRVNETLKLVNSYIKGINDILNIGYSDFDEYIRHYFNMDISYLIPETMLDNKIKALTSQILGNRIFHQCNSSIDPLIPVTKIH